MRALDGRLAGFIVHCQINKNSRSCALQSTADRLQTNDQVLSLTDQLNLGVRMIEMDAHWVQVRCSAVRLGCVCPSLLCAALGCTLLPINGPGWLCGAWVLCDICRGPALCLDGTYPLWVVMLVMSLELPPPPTQGTSKYRQEINIAGPAQGDFKIAHCGGFHSFLNLFIKAVNLVAKLLHHHIRWDTETIGCDPRWGFGCISCCMTVVCGLHYKNILLRMCSCLLFRWGRCVMA